MRPKYLGASIPVWVDDAVGALHPSIPPSLGCMYADLFFLLWVPQSSCPWCGSGDNVLTSYRKKKETAQSDRRPGLESPPRESLLH